MRSPTGVPRYAVALGSETAFNAAVERIKASGVVGGDVRECSQTSPFVRSFRFVDFDQNHFEICMNRRSLGDIALSHVVLETIDLEGAIKFYSEALGLSFVGEFEDEHFFTFPNHQLIGVKPVAMLSDRTKRHGRAVHVALNVRQEDFDRMLELIPACGGANQGDARLRTACVLRANAALTFPTRTPTNCRSPPTGKKIGRSFPTKRSGGVFLRIVKRLGEACRASTAASNRISKITMALEKPVIPTFSLAERERRWSTLRSEMKKAHFHALISLPTQSHWDQFGADTRYITQIGGTQTEVGAVLPLEGDVTAMVRGANEIEWWGLAQDWVVDIRPSRRSYGEPVIDRLKETRAERVGVIGLSGLVRAPEGVVPWGTFEKIREALPNVQSENATT